jgi:hypothetical protein
VNVFLRRTAGLLAVASALSLAACAEKILDFRNAEVSSGKIFSKGENTPFTGKLTNIPFTKIQSAGLAPFLPLIATVTGNKGFAELFMVNAIAALMGNSNGGLLCNTTIKAGYLNGATECGLEGKTVLNLSYKDGSLDGKVQFIDPSISKEVAQGQLANGKLEGESKIFDARSGQLLHTVNWKQGVTNGAEESRNKDGKTVFKATIVDGKYDGEAKRFDEKGELVITSYFKAGVAERDVRPGLSDEANCVEDWVASRASKNLPKGDEALYTAWRQACKQGTRWNSPGAELVKAAPSPASAASTGQCVDQWTAAHRKEVGSDAMISGQQLDEWEQWCVEGKKPA